MFPDFYQKQILTYTEQANHLKQAKDATDDLSERRKLAREIEKVLLLVADYKDMLREHHPHYIAETKSG